MKRDGGGLICVQCKQPFERRQHKTRPRSKCYVCSPERPNTTARINEECARDIWAYFRQLRHKGRAGLRASKLSIDDLMSLWKSQQGCCALSGIPMTHVWGAENVWNASPDQIIPASKGGDYSPSNVRLICKLFQTMRGNLDDSAFKAAIIEAARHIQMEAQHRSEL